MASWNQSVRSRLEHNPWYPWLTFIFVAAGAFIVNVDSSIINVALPTIQETFQLKPSVLQWIMTAYLLIVTGLLPSIGMLGDMTGRKRIFIAGIITLAFGSILCSLAGSVQQLIIFRIIQAFGGAMIMANVSALVTDIFPQGKRGRPLGIIGSVVAIGTIVGPSLGGILIDLFGWRTIFLVNIPICLFSVIGVFIFLSPKRPSKSSDRKFDYSGGLLFFIAMTTLLLYVSNGQNWGWLSLPSIFSFVITILSWTVFVRLERKIDHPLIDLSFFKNPMFTYGSISGYISYVLMFIPAIIVPLYLHHVLHIPPLHIGLLMTPQAVAMIIASPMSGLLSDRFGTHVPTLTGMTFISVSLWMMAQFDAVTNYNYIIAAFSVFGIGFGLFNAANNLSILESVPANKTGVTGGLVATMRNFGRVSGVALAILLLEFGISSFGSGTNYDKATSFVFYSGSTLGAFTVALLFIRLKLSRNDRQNKRFTEAL